MSIVDTVFSPLYGKPCWSVRISLGNSLSFEFGDPRLIIREPKVPKREVSEEVQRHFARREVKVRGSWHLWVSFSGWRFYQQDKEIGTSITPEEELNAVITEIDGQALQKVTVEVDGVTAFRFDLGGLLETYPVIHPEDTPETMDCWTLFEPSGKALTLRKDVKYLYESRKAWTQETDWLPLFPKTA
jgi:hypothetical protein